MGMSYTNRFTEVHEPRGVLNCDSRAAGNHTTGWLLMSNYERVIFILDVGEMQAGATLDFQVRQALNAAGTGEQAIAGKAITQLTQAGGDDDELVAIEVRGEELDVDGGYEYVRGLITIAGAAVECSLIPLFHVPAYPPVPITAWTEIVD